MRQRRQEGESSSIYLNASTRLLAIRAFAAQTRGPLILLAMLLVLSLFGAYRLRCATRNAASRRMRRRARLQHVARHWIALGLLPPMLCAYLLAPLAPLPLVRLVILFHSYRLFSCCRLLSHHRFAWCCIASAGVYAFSAFAAWMAFSPATKREVQIRPSTGRLRFLRDSAAALTHSAFEAEGNSGYASPPGDKARRPHSRRLAVGKLVGLCQTGAVPGDTVPVTVRLSPSAC